MSACMCPGCGGHGEWLRQKRKEEARVLAENTVRFAEWLVQEKRAGVEEAQRIVAEAQGRIEAAKS